MRIIIIYLAPLAILLAGCGLSAGTRPPPPRPAYHIAPPPPGERRCVVWGEDMYGRRFCDRYYRS